MRRPELVGGWLVVGCLALTGCGRSVQGSVIAAPGATRDLGFQAAFEAELEAVDAISTEEFQRRYAPPGYLGRLSWDPTTAKFWDRLMADPAAPQPAEGADALASHPPEAVDALRSGGRAAEPHDFRLNDDELRLFRRNGFVVSERMGSHSFTDLYHRIYVHDLPVFVTADSILHAWHRQFDRLLEGLETEEIQPALARLTAAMAGELPAARRTYRSAVLQTAADDVDFFLCVARRLLAPEGGATSAFGQERRVQDALAACGEEATFAFELFGKKRIIDFSQFKPRGRYDLSEPARQYFRGVMWLSRMDFRLSGTNDPNQELRELGAVAVLADLLQRSGEAEQWRELDRLLTRFVGQADCLSFTQVDALLRASDAGPAAEMTDATLASVHRRLQKGEFDAQQIRGEVFCLDPGDPERFVLPTNFCFLGQRFVLDSWALSKVVYDDIVWSDEEVKRRVPSCLDVSFAVFASDHATPRLVERMTATAGREFRDGLPYQHNLAAVRNVVDALPESAWEASVYSQWLRCLRELSAPTTAAKYPEAMRTEAWAQRMMATQLASWTQLRHDTVLYAKPSYTLGVMCYYPAGYVEPVPEFWRRLDDMVRQTGAFFEQSQLAPRGDAYAPGQERARKWRLESLQRFAATTAMLRTIAEKQLAQAELNAEETTFLQEIVVRNNACGAPPVGGWYPQLFAYRGKGVDEDAQKWTALVTDVHTDPPDLLFTGDPGCVLHQGIGNVELLIVAIDSGKDRVVYAGPVFSHYEFETPRDVRLTNGEWQSRLREGQAPPRPEWAATYSVPGENPKVAEYGLDPFGR